MPAGQAAGAEGRGAKDASAGKPQEDGQVATGHRWSKGNATVNAVKPEGLRYITLTTSTGRWHGQVQYACRVIFGGRTARVRQHAYACRVISGGRTACDACRFVWRAGRGEMVEVGMQLEGRRMGKWHGQLFSQGYI